MRPVALTHNHHSFHRLSRQVRREFVASPLEQAGFELPVPPLMDDAMVFCLLMGDYPTERIAARAILSFGEKTRGLVVESREPWWRARNGLCFCGGTEG